ncbi:MAG: GNAT family N-acetyltransferase [Ruminococcus flavefaciens]|nr:GNAT family N-acetyltransferase [Ruminococcus flavefaciens]
MGNIWIATDLHLYSRDNDSRHPFRSRHNIGKLSDQFAQDIQEDDLLIFLGDLCDPDVTDTDKLAAIVQRIPCRKLMCRGNHDLQDDEFYLRVGFDEVTEVIRLYNIIFSHKPIKVAADEVNVHGHLHTEKLVTMGWNHINAYAANWNKDDHPVLLEDLLKSAIVQEHEYTSKELAHVTEKFEKYTSLENDQYTKIMDISDWFPLCPPEDEPIDETVTTDRILRDIYNFNTWMDKNFRYGLRINGKWDPKRNTTSDDWDRYLVVQSPEEIAKSKVGVCWDYVSYEAQYFKEHFPNVPVKTYYMQFFNGADCPSHTILTFEWSGKHYYFECSFRKFAGLYEAKSEEDIINFVLKLMSDNPDPSIPKGDLLKKWGYDAWEYNALDHALFGMHCQEYMDYVMGGGKCLHHEYKKPGRVKKVELSSMVESTDIIDEVLFKDVDDTKYWLKDDKEYREQAEKGEESEKSVAAIDEAARQAIDPLIFVSESDELDEFLIEPDVPENFMTKNGFEDNTTPRICFSTSIGKALRALSMDLTGSKLYVYTPVQTGDRKPKFKVITPTKEQVPDVEITEERWICQPIWLDKVAKIEVSGPAKGKGYKYTYGKNNEHTATLYDWEYEFAWSSMTDKCGGVEYIVNETTGKIQKTKLLHATFAEIKRIVDAIPKEEHHYFYHDDQFKDSPNVVYRAITKERRRNGGAAFIEVYAFDDNPDVGIVVIAATPNGRGHGLTDYLINQASKECPTIGIKTLLWRCDLDNVASRNLALRNGFRDITPPGNDQYKFEKTLDVPDPKIIHEMAYEDAQDFMIRMFNKYCREFNKKDKYFDTIRAKWKKENPNAGEPPKLKPRLDHGNDNQIMFTLADLNTDNATVNQIASYWDLVKHLCDAIKKDPEFKKFAYITRINAEAEDFVGAYIDLMGIEAFSADSPEVYWPKITARVTESENPNDWKSKKAVDIKFFNDKHVKIGEASVSGIDTKEPYLYNIEVYPRYRGKKYGNAIMRYLMRMYNPTELCVESDNVPALKMYERFGFKKDGYFEDFRVTMLVMRTKPKHNGKLVEEPVSEAVADTHPVDREQKADIAKKYGLQAVGDTHEAEEADEKERKRKEAEKAKLEKEKELERKREARNKALAKGRRTQKRNRIIKKVKSHLPGVKNEEADAVDGSDAAYIDDIFTEHDAQRGDRVRMFNNHRDYENASLDESSHTYRFEMLDRVQFFDRIDESSSDEKTPSPVFVVLINGNSPISAAIRGLTHSEFTHASISFDSSLTKMYSFAGKDLENKIEALIGGFKLENIKSEFYTKNKIPYAVYVVPSTKGAVKRMQKRLEYFIKNETKFRFDYLGLIKNFFKIPDNPENTWFCSRFVADILNAGSPDKKLIDQPSLYRPEDFKSAGFAQFVDSGLAANYNPKTVDKKVKMILRAKKLDEGVLDVALDNPWAHQVLNYQLTMMDEAAVNDFITYLQSFKLRFDKDGNIVVTRREFDQLDTHFRSSLKTIKACENAGNVEGVKEELYKIHYMVELINRYYLRPDVKNLKSNAREVRKDMLDLRSVMLNAFQQHLKYVTTRDPRWNFQSGYDSSKYGKNLTIPQKVITAIGKTMITALT